MHFSRISSHDITVTDLQNYLTEVLATPEKTQICKQRVLCRTLAGVAK